MHWLFVIVVLALAALGWYLFRPHRSAEGDPRRDAREREERLRKRLVRTPADMEGMGDVRALVLTVPDRTKACAAARQAAGESYLTFDAPPLPLPGCNIENCHCSYYAVPGRRSGEDRRSGQDRRASVRFDPGKQDRRSGKDRRRGGTDPWKGRA